MKFEKKITIAALFGMILIACGNPSAPSNTVTTLPTPTASNTNEAPPTVNIDGQETKVIGKDSLLPVKVDASNIDLAYRNLVNAFGIIHMGSKGYCSGTHIGNGYVITAGHCFFNDSENGTSTESSTPEKLCASTKVYWGFRGTPAPGTNQAFISLDSKCTKMIYAENSTDRDFAIFKVDQAPVEKVNLSNSAKRSIPGTKITLFGFPQGRPLEWSQYCTLKKGMIPSLGFTSPSQFIYQCDTEPGNSGSSVLAIDSFKIVRLIGVHNGSASDGVNYNYGTYLFDIREILEKNGFKLDEAVAASAQVN